MQQQAPKLSHYILGKTLGHGAFGRVKEATHEFTGTKVAIKIINKRKMKTKKMTAKTKRQIRYLQYFNHPNIVRLYHVLENLTDIFLVMELAPKGELFGLIYQHGKMSEALGRSYFKQILSGVEYCHQNLVAHRDLKPQNILVGDNGLLKIVDFGLSSLMKDGKFLSTSCGSLSYASPEIICGKAYQGTLVDVWSCGVVLFAMLAGYLPFDEEHDIQLYRKIETGSYVVPNFLSREAKDLIHRMIEVEPSKRISVHEIKNHPWMRERVPLYAHVPSAFTAQHDPPFHLNNQAISAVMSYNLDFSEHTTKESLVKAIKKKEDLSFVVAYQLLVNEQEKHNHRVEQAEEPRAKIFEEVPNRLSQEQKIDCNWQYGRTYRTSARDLARRVMEVLSSMNTAASIKSSDYKIRCTYTPRRLTSASSFMSVDSEPDEGILEEKNGDERQFETMLPKYTRKEITFSINIYEVKPNEHLLDLQLNRGHPFIFVEYVDVFLAKVNSTFDR